MKINGIGSSNLSVGGKSKQPCFKANIIPKVQSVLMDQAKNSELLYKCVAQVNNLKDWGSPKSFINIAIEGIEEGKLNRVLCLDNYNISNNFSGSLGVDGSKPLIQQFLSLRDDNIISAEKSLQNQLNIKIAIVVHSAMHDKTLMKQLCGKMTSNVKEIEAAVRNLPEEVIIEKALESPFYAKSNDKRSIDFIQKIIGVA